MARRVKKISDTEAVAKRRPAGFKRERTCETCGKAFVARHSRTLNCSMKCRAKAKAARDNESRAARRAEGSATPNDPKHWRSYIERLKANPKEYEAYLARRREDARRRRAAAKA